LYLFPHFRAVWHCFIIRGATADETQLLRQDVWQTACTFPGVVCSKASVWKQTLRYIPHKIEVTETRTGFRKYCVTLHSNRSEIVVVMESVQRLKIRQHILWSLSSKTFTCARPFYNNLPQKRDMSHFWTVVWCSGLKA